jgi:hypothetical protein
MVVFEPKTKETTEDRLQKAINLGREEALQEVLEWLDENIEIKYDDEDVPFVYFTYFCYNTGDLLQLFKERFNIE